MESFDVSKAKQNLLRNVHLMFDESVTSFNQSITYSLDDVKKWVEFGLNNEYINVLKADEIKNWIKMLKDKTVTIK